MNNFAKLPKEVQTVRKTEILIAMDCVMTLISDGFTIGVYDGQEIVLKNSTNLSEILDKLGSTDEDQLIAYKDGKRFGWIQFVYGNDGWDVIADHSTNLQTILEPIMEKHSI